MPKDNEEWESKLFELRVLRNRARKMRAFDELDEAKKLYSQAIEVAREIKSPEEAEKLGRIVKIIELDMLLRRLQTLEDHLTQMVWTD